jgi:hypothetical protein
MSLTKLFLFLAELNRLGVRCAAAITSSPGTMLFGMKCVWVPIEIGDDKIFYCDTHHETGQSFEVVK